MTFEQAQLLIRIFILQHYDENVEDVIQNVKHKGKVSDLRLDFDGDWIFDFAAIVFFSNVHSLHSTGKIVISTTEKYETDNILDYITLEEELT